jgi:peptidoglycan hydrolase-like protein with peptidoglycan-binding domain
MKNRYIMRMAAIYMAIIIASAPMSTYASTVLKEGSRGSEVVLVQTSLQKLGYYTYPTLTGYYGSLTKAAVKRFQKDNGILADGIVGETTMGILIPDITQVSADAMTLAVLSADVQKLAEETNELQSLTAVSADVQKLAEETTESQSLTAVSASSEYSGDLDWFTLVRDIWKRGMNAVVTDVDTGKSFNVKRTYGTNHADVETLTQADTDMMKEIWGGFSWERRAVVVQIGGYTLAGSMTAMPHAGLDNKKEGAWVSGRSAGYGYGYNYDAVKNNGINGHMDIHFKNSRTHGTNVVQKVHQDMVKKAAEYIEKIILNNNL